MVFVGAGNAVGTPPLKSRGLHRARTASSTTRHSLYRIILCSSPWIGDYATLASWHDGVLKETSSVFLCSVRVEEVDEGQTITGNRSLSAW